MIDWVRSELKRKKKVLLVNLIIGGIFAASIIPAYASPSESTYTPQVQLLLTLVVLVSIMIAAIVFGLLIYVIIRFRENSNTIRKPIKNEMRLEIAWIVFATVIVVSLFAVSLPVTESYFTEQEFYDEEILVIAYQYNFTFVREDGSQTIDVVYLRVNEMYMFNLTSIDVIHSFYVHELSIKLDMIPGRYNIIYVQISQPGVYEVHCAEYCGFGHYSMEAKIVVQ